MANLKLRRIRCVVVAAFFAIDASLLLNVGTITGRRGRRRPELVRAFAFAFLNL